MKPALEVLLVDPDPHYVTCPMSNSVIAGLRAMSSITVSRSGLAREARNTRERIAATLTTSVTFPADRQSLSQSSGQSIGGSGEAVVPSAT